WRRIETLSGGILLAASSRFDQGFVVGGHRYRPANESSCGVLIGLSASEITAHAPFCATSCPWPRPPAISMESAKPISSCWPAIRLTDRLPGVCTLLDVHVEILRRVVALLLRPIERRLISFKTSAISPRSRRSPRNSFHMIRRR